MPLCDRFWWWLRCAICLRLGQQVTPDQLNHMMETLDQARSGKIHYQDYLNMATTAIKEQTKHFKVSLSHAPSASCIALSCRLTLWQAGTVIFKEGDKSDFFYLITSGRVRKITRRQDDLSHARWLSPDEV